MSSGKLTSDDEDLPSPKTSTALTESLIEEDTTNTIPPTRSNISNIPKITEATTINKTEENIQEVTDKAIKPKPRLLSLNVEELQNFANALHNQTKSLEKNSKKVIDLSDISLDDDDEDLPRTSVESKHNIPDKFYSNFQEPFHSILPDRRSEETETCREDKITYKVLALIFLIRINFFIKKSHLTLMETFCKTFTIYYNICIKSIIYK